MSFSRVPTSPTSSAKKILLMADRFQMVRPNASRIPTEMVEFHTSRHRTIREFVSDDMCQPLLPTP